MRSTLLSVALLWAACTPDPEGSPRPTVPEEPSPIAGSADAHDQGTADTGSAPDDSGIDDPPKIDDGESRLVLRINEVVADNRQIDPLGDGSTPDWLELYSLLEEDLDLSGYTISDDPEDPAKHVLPDGLVLPAGGHLLLWASGQPDLGPEHLGFAISDDGEELAVYTPLGGNLDRVQLPAQARNLAAQRTPDGSETWQYSYRVSPGAPNTEPPSISSTPLPAGSDWSYLDGGLIPDSAWAELGFDASAWPVGPAPLGYGDAHQVSILDYGPDAANKAPSYYFRTEVELEGVSELLSASLGYLRDDGIAMYVNGVEVRRDNLPAGILGPDTLASSTIAEASETAWQAVDIDPALLVEGTNILAAQVHQATAGSSDLGFDLSITLEHPAEDDKSDSVGTKFTHPPELPVPLESYILDDFVVHRIDFEIDTVAYNRLQVDSTTYQPATFLTEDAEMQVAIRVKGSSTWRPITEKPSLKLQFDYYDETQQYWGLSAVNLHNMTYDPSLLAESTSYWVYREAGWPAPRTSYAEVRINGEYRGLYAIVENKNQRFLEHWLEDPSGSVYESGSFNWGCDVDDLAPAGQRCDCFEHDHVGDGDTTDDLSLMCTEATLPDPELWLDAMRTRLDWEAFLGTLTTDMALAHWDSYGYNLNNWHMIHEPSTGRWWWTPWSTDLAFGWNPWGAGWCDQLGIDPSDYGRYGYLANRCLNLPECAEDLREAMRSTADHLDSLDVAGRIAAADAIASAYAPLEPYPWYSAADQAAHAACIVGFMAERPDQMRIWAGP